MSTWHINTLQSTPTMAHYMVTKRTEALMGTITPVGLENMWQDATYMRCPEQAHPEAETTWPGPRGGATYR